MELATYIEKFRQTRLSIFKWRYELNLVYQLLLAFGFACVTGLLAQVKIYLPWTPVPITGQTFAVLMSGVVLGRWGGVSQLMYVGLGALGIPWFEGWSGGFSVVIGATGGYLLGFILASFFLGYFVDKYIRARTFFSFLVLLFFSNFVLIYIPGLFQLYLWLKFSIGSNISFAHLLMIGAVPFIIGDILKIVITAVIARTITPQQAFDKETDA